MGRGFWQNGMVMQHLEQQGSIPSLQGQKTPRRALGRRYLHRNDGLFERDAM